MGGLEVGLPDSQLLLTGQFDHIYYYERLELQTQLPTIFAKTSHRQLRWAP